MEEPARILSELVAAEHQAIAFVRARVVSEIVARYAQEFVSRLSPSRAKLIKSYRGGYLPEERRAIERALFAGELKAVVSTNALELGIDIGSMEAALLIGYPGWIASTWQQAGRAGRGADPSLVILLPYDSPIDQYMARHPDYFFGSSPENACFWKAEYLRRGAFNRYSSAQECFCRHGRECCRYSWNVGIIDHGRNSFRRYRLGFGVYG